MSTHHGPIKTNVIPAGVAQWRPYAEQASHAYHVPTSVLLALIDEESAGIAGQTSRTGAKGITQFEPATAASYHVNTEPGGEYSQVMGAAAYLHNLGYSHDPQKALASYNAGPGNWQAGIGYANAVLQKAQTYGANLTTTPATPATPQTHPTPAASSSNPLIPNERGTGKALEWLTYALLFTLGAALAYTGVKRTVAARSSS